MAVAAVRAGHLGSGWAVDQAASFRSSSVFGDSLRSCSAGAPPRVHHKALSQPVSAVSCTSSIGSLGLHWCAYARASAFLDVFGLFSFFRSLSDRFLTVGVARIFTFFLQVFVSFCRGSA